MNIYLKKINMLISNYLILSLVASAFMATLVLTSCYSSVEKVENAEDNVMEANKELDKANENYLAEIERYKKETADKLAANNKSIVEFKARIAAEKKDVTAEYNEEIANLEQKNSDMQRKIDNYKAESREQWDAFKSEFNHDMEELGKAFSGLTKNNDD